MPCEEGRSPSGGKMPSLAQATEVIMWRTAGRLLILVAAGLPGVALALAAKPFVLGEAALEFGFLLALAGPVAVAAIGAGRRKDRMPGKGGPSGEL